MFVALEAYLSHGKKMLTHIQLIIYNEPYMIKKPNRISKKGGMYV